DLRTRNPNLFTFAEQADWGTIGSEFLPVFNAALGKQIMFAIRSAATSGSVAGVYSTISDALATLPANAAATNRTYLISLGDHDVDRFMSNTGDNMARMKAAAAIVFTQPMTPLIYFGDEIGMRGVRATGTTDANDIPNREPFKWNRIAGAPMSNYFVRNTTIYNARYERDNDGRSVE